MTKLKKPLLFTLCLLPIAALGSWSATKISLADMDEKTLEAAVQQAGSLEIIMLVSVLQSVIIAVICGFFGYIISGKIGLLRLFGLSGKETVITMTAGAVCGFVLSTDAFVFIHFLPRLEDVYKASGSFDAHVWIASVLYGGVIEEVMLRLFLMSLLSLIGRKLFCKKEDTVPERILIVSNVIASLLFAAGHLPATITTFGQLTPLVVFRCFLMNGSFGIVYGRLYRKYGIQYAMIAHIVTHIVSRTIWIIIF